MRLPRLLALLFVLSGARIATADEAPKTQNAPHSEGPDVLIFGGAWGPDGNQASIELHVRALGRALERARPTIFYGAPNPSTRAVQIEVSKKDEVSELLGRVFGANRGLHVSYRRSKVPRQAPGDRQSVSKWFDAHTGPSVVFGVGHGSRVGKDNEKQSQLSLWGGAGELKMSDLIGRLEKKRRSGPLSMVLGQCHSGGFVDIMYTQGEPHRGLATPARCVLAAVPHDRVASGCTADVNDPSARAFMGLIAEALSDRKSSDLDQDERVSLEEAFTFARIRDQTVNLPVRSSEAYMRDRLGKKAPTLAKLTVKQLLAWARPSERAVLKALLPDPKAKRVSTIEKRFQRDEDTLEALDKSVERAWDTVDDARTKVQDRLFDRFPELSNRFHASSRRLLAGNAAEVVGFLRSLDETRALADAETRAQAAVDARDALERKLVQKERWLRAADNVVFERALRPKDKKALGRLYRCESALPIPR